MRRLSPLLFLLAVACASPAVGEKRLAVLIFANETFEPSLERELSRSIKEALGGRWKIENRKPESGSVLTGTIVSLDLIPLSLDPGGIVREYRAKITIDWTVEAVGENGERSRRVITERLAGAAEFRVVADPAQTRAAQERAIREAAKNLGEEIAARIERERALLP